MKYIRFVRYFSLIALVAATAISCGFLLGGENTGDVETMAGLAEALIEFPAALVTSQADASRVTIKETTAEGITSYLDYLYKPVRSTYNPLALSAVEFVETVLDAVETKIFAEGSIRRALETSGSWTVKNNTNTEAHRVTRSEGDYTVETWKIIDSAWLKTLHLEFGEAAGAYRGTVIAVKDTPGLSERPIYEVTFDTNDATFGQVTEVRAVKIKYDDGIHPNIARKLWLKAWQTDNDFFVAANIHYTHVNIQTDSPFYDEFMTELGQQAGTDTVNASYIYRGSVDIDTEQGAVSLALVPEGLAGVETVFTDYSIGELYKRAISDWVRTDPDAESTPTQKLISVINNILTAVGADLIDTTSTDDEIFAALEATKSYLDSAGQSSNDLNAILFVVKAVNPGYYDAISGFVGTEALNKPTWAGDVPAHDQSIDVSAAVIAADTYTVVMPAPAEPDF